MDPTARRIVLRRFAASQQDAVDNVLQLEDMARPDAALLGPGEVIVEVRSAAVGFVDLLMMSGQYQHLPPLPCTPGMEYAGVVVATGPAVKPEALRVGDGVLSDFFHTGPRSHGAYRANGGWATHAIAPAHGLHRIPAGFSFDQACNLLLNYETAYYAFVTRARLQPGETVLVNGASGAAGMAAVQVAKLLGARVIATGRSDAKLEHVKRQGADHLLNTRNDASGALPRFREQVRVWTDGAGADVVFDTVGGELSLESMRSLRFGGRHVIVGWAANTTVAKGHGQRGSDNADRLPTNIIQMKGLQLLGAPMVINTMRDMSIRAERLRRIMGWASEGHLKPHVSHRCTLSDFRAGARAKLNGEVIGGCVLAPGEAVPFGSEL